MRKILGFLGWILFGLIGTLLLLEMFASLSNAYRSEVNELLSKGIYGAMFLLLSGICRRIFGLKRHVVRNRGLLPAIFSRINCMRFYFSIFYYGTLTASLFFLGKQDEGDILKGLLLLFVTFIFFTIVRHTCPRCGAGLNHKGDSYSREVEVSDIDDTGYSTSQQKTSHYQCPRCGRRVRMRSTESLRHNF